MCEPRLTYRRSLPERGCEFMPRENAMGVARFPATQWSLVGRAGHVTGSRRREALGTLLHRYMPAMRTHLVLARRMSPDQADDLIQGFVTDKIIEQIAVDLNLESPKAASNRLITAKRLFARVMRSVVAEYVNDERGIDDEIKDLMRILSQHG